MCAGEHEAEGFWLTWWETSFLHLRIFQVALVPSSRAEEQGGRGILCANMWSGVRGEVSMRGIEVIANTKQASKVCIPPR